MTSALTNATVGPYILRELISAGGVAEVFKAQHRDGAGEYAVKVMRPERRGEKHHLKAFKAEYDLLTRLDHPGIPKGRRYDTVRERPCMVMSFVPGRPLHHLLDEHVLLASQDIFLKLVEIVAYLHGEGIVHNDIKLENVLLRPDGRVALVDFGNARLAQKRGLISRLFKGRDPVFGTPTYLAPELVAGEGEPTFHSDLYSLGVCCFLLFTGEPPFVNDRKSARLRAAVNQAPPSLASRRTGLSSNFVKLIDACLAKDPAHRPEDAQRLLHACKLASKAATEARMRPIDVD